MFNWLSRSRQFRKGEMGGRAKRQRSRRVIVGAVHSTFEALEDRTMFSFSAPVSLASGTTPSDVIVADFTGDGKNDIAQLNASASTVLVTPGNGDGTFQSGVSSAAGGVGTIMVAADFNHDGKLDIVVDQGTELQLLDGNGDGSFHDGGVYYCGAYANDVKACDINHDGWCDLETCSFSYGGTTQLLINNGSGGFQPERNIAVNNGGIEVEAADVNNDGNPDLIEQGVDGINDVLFGDGTGAFRPAPISLITTNLQDAQVGDFNHDGMADLVVSDASTLEIYAGNTAGVYASPTYITVPNATHLAIGDVNGDGNADIVTNSGFAILGRGNGTFASPTPYGQSTGGSHIALGDFNGDSSSDEVSASPGGDDTGISVALNGNDDSQRLSTATHFGVSSFGKAAAGAPFDVTVTALDANGNVATNFLGSVGIYGWTGSRPVYYTFTAADQGVHTVPNAAEFFTTGVQTYSVTSPFLPTATGTVNVTGAAAAKFDVSSPTSTVAGAQSSITISAVDDLGNPTTAYWGTVFFTSSDHLADLPASYTFTDADAGTHTFNITYKTAGVQIVTVFDPGIDTISGTSASTRVSPAAATSLSLTGGSGYVESVNIVNVTARDPFGNIDTNYNGIVHLSTSDPNSLTSADAPLVNGAGMFTVTPMTVGQQTLRASDVATGDLLGSETINVTAGAGLHFSATPLANATAGQTQTTTVSLVDADGNIATAFVGTVAIRSTDPKAAISYVSFTAADAGVKTIPVTLYTAGTQAVTISALSDASVTTTQTGIHVSPAAVSRISVTPVVGTVAGTTQNIVISARDAYGNIATGYTGALAFSTSDTQATIPATYTFTAADAGTHTFPITFKSAGGQTLTITDANNPATQYDFQNDIIITPAALSGFSFTGGSVSGLIAGTSLNVTLTAIDSFGNTITNYAGTVLLTSTDAQASFAASYTFMTADAGAHVFTIAYKTAGSQSITATDSVNSAITGATSSSLKAAAVSKLLITTSATATAGAAQSVTVTATDAYGNVITNYSGTVNFSSSDAAALLPANYAFNNKDVGTHTFNVTFKTAGSQSLTVSDSVNAALTENQTGIAVKASTAVVAGFTVSGFPASTAGAAKTFTVTAKDAAGNVVTGYTGTVNFSSSDVQAGLPTSYSFTAADSGSHTFTATLKTAGSQSITVSDAAASVLGIESGIAVSPAAATKFVMSHQRHPGTRFQIHRRRLRRLWQSCHQLPRQSPSQQHRHQSRQLRLHLQLQR
jgi:hypothetical protein